MSSNKFLGKIKKGFKSSKDKTKDKLHGQSSSTFEEPFLEDQDRAPKNDQIDNEESNNNGKAQSKLTNAAGNKAIGGVGSEGDEAKNSGAETSEDGGGKVKQARFADQKKIQTIGEDEQYEGIDEDGLPNDEPQEQDGAHLKKMFSQKSSKRNVSVLKQGTDKEATQYHFEGGTVVFGVSLAVYLFIVIVGLVIFKVHFLKMAFYGLIYFLIGVGSTYLYYRKKNFRVENKQKINVNLGVKGLSAYFMTPPTWIKLSDTEKCEWLNNILEQCWPYYDKAICDNIIQTVGPTLDDYIFPPVKHLEIEQLRFGDNPIRFENVQDVSEDSSSHIIEMEVRWKGDSKIILGIDTNGLGEIHPKVTNITFVGKIRIILRPLLPVMPGFGAVLATFRRPPIVKYQLNFGKLGGSAVANQVKPIIDNIIRDQLANMLVWPNRFITPILPEEITGNLDYLKVNTQGVVKVELLRGVDLKKMDNLGQTDGFAEMFTQPENTQRSSVKKKTLNPQWNETFFHLVQEPTYQFLRISVYDVDLLNVQQMTKHGLNIFKGMQDTFNAKQFLGRTLVDLSEVCKYPGIPTEKLYPLGRLDWSNPDGCGTGYGQLQIKMTYQPLKDNNPSRGSEDQERCKKKIKIKYNGASTYFAYFIHTALRCALIVHLRKGKVPQASKDNDDDIPNPFVKLEIGKKKFQSNKLSTNEPNWDQKFTWFKINSSDSLQVQLMDETGMIDDVLGEMAIPISEIIKSSGTDRYENTIRGLLEREFQIGQGNTLDFKLNYISYY